MIHLICRSPGAGKTTYAERQPALPAEATVPQPFTVFSANHVLIKDW